MVTTSIQVNETDFKDGNYNDDWAFIVLDKPIGEDYGYLGWKSLSPETLIKDKEKYVFVGYSGDFPNSPQYSALKAGPGMTAGVHPGCSITGEEDGLLKHDCDTTGGSSGGPIIAWINQKPYIVALNNMEVKTRANGTPLFNLAVKISRIEQVLNGQ
ncbi:trypsin-like serine peptidase [Nostoc sp. PCC 9305]|uniref:trypsin-like serine peptidase n=1 Tax=Nostoc sp. PCC 9305 TaxID=296636 RepID=UPI0039C687FF